MPGTGQQAGSPRRAPLSPGSGSPASPGRSWHEDAAPPPVQNVFLGPCPGIRPGISPGISPGSTGGGSAGRCHLGSEDTGHCPSPPTPAGLWAAWPVPALPCSPSRPQGTLWPQTQPSSGRKAEGNLWPHLAAAPSPAQPGTPPWHHRGWVGTGAPIPPGFTAPAPLSPRQPLPRGVWGVCGFPGSPLPLPGTALPWLGVHGR